MQSLLSHPFHFLIKDKSETIYSGAADQRLASQQRIKNGLKRKDSGDWTLLASRNVGVSELGIRAANAKNLPRGEGSRIRLVQDLEEGRDGPLYLVRLDRRKITISFKF